MRFNPDSPVAATVLKVLAWAAFARHNAGGRWLAWLLLAALLAIPTLATWGVLGLFDVIPDPP